MPINFRTKLFKICSWNIVHLPKSASSKLPSRGMVMVEGTVNSKKFKAALEPDGKGSHWFKLDNLEFKSGDDLTLKIKPIKDWSEPVIPKDLKKELSTSTQANEVWKSATPMARWDWIRWVRSTKNSETRKKRIKTACSKLKSGMKRPCCFNRSLCTEPKVCSNGVMIEPKEEAGVKY